MNKLLFFLILSTFFFCQLTLGQEMIVLEGQLVEKKLEIEEEKVGISFKSIFDKISFEEAIRKAKQKDNKVLIYFTATYCGACRIMEKVKFPNDSLPNTIKSLYIPLVNNHDSCGTELEQAYNIQAFPTFVIINDKKEVIKRHIGRMEIPDLAKFLSINDK